MVVEGAGYHGPVRTIRRWRWVVDRDGDGGESNETLGVSATQVEEEDDWPLRRRVREPGMGRRTF